MRILGPAAGRNEGGYEAVAAVYNVPGRTPEEDH